MKNFGIFINFYLYVHSIRLVNMSSSLNRKRYSTWDVNQLAKRKAADIEPLASPNQMKITDLNPDCLEHIFKYLHIEDLLNVADSRKSLKNAVDQAFTCKYEKRILISLIFMIPLIETQLKNGREEKIECFGSTLKFLRCFGKLIAAIKIHFFPKSTAKSKTNALRHYLGEYCTEKLTELNILHCPNGFIPVSKPFVSLEKLHFVAAMDAKLIDLNRCFPKLSYLCLVGVSNLNPKCFEVHLPHLKNYTVFGKVKVTFLRNCLRLNPQIEILKIQRLKGRSILNVVRECRQLKDFEISHPEKSQSTKCWIRNFIKQHTSIEKISIILSIDDYFGELITKTEDVIEMLKTVIPDKNRWHIYAREEIFLFIDLVRTKN